VTFEALLYHVGDGADRVRQRRVLQTGVPASWSDTRHLDHFGWTTAYYYERAGAVGPPPRGWDVGRYGVDLYVGGRTVVTETFRIR
jgi:hypothetical protein